MLTTTKKILRQAEKFGYAVGAFNVNDLEVIEAVLEAALAEHSPVIIQTSEGAVEYAGLHALGGAVHGLALYTPKYAGLPIAFHLDHGKNPKLVKEAIKSGWYTSVMIDASALPFKENVEITRDIILEARHHGISVEAELGSIAGIEDFISVKDQDAHLTDPKQARAFIRETGCDSLAVAIGTSHGAYKYKGDPKLDLERLQKIKKMIGQTPLVLHGASSVPEELKKRCLAIGCEIKDAKGVDENLVKQAIKNGISKVNIDTDLRLAFTVGVREAVLKNPKNIDPRKILGPAKKLMTELVRKKMRLLGSSGKA